MGGKQFPRHHAGGPRSKSGPTMVNMPPRYRPVPKRAAEADMLANKSEHLNVGDSIGFAALIIGVLAVVLMPPFWLKIPLLLLSAVGCLVFLLKSHWTHVWPKVRQYLVAGVAILILGLIGIPQLVSQWRIEHPEHPANASPLPPFSAAVEFLYSGIYEPGAMLPFWTSNGDRLLCRVHMLTFLRLVNLQTAPALIDKFDVEVIATDGHWVKLRRMDTISWTPYLGTDKKRLIAIDAPFLDRQIVGHPIPAKGAVRGWVFYDNPESANSFALTNTVRITVSDFTGNMYVADPAQVALGSVQDITFGILKRARQDLSRIPAVDHCGAP